MGTSPCISVLLPVYNARRYVAEAVRSILSQTFGDFECIIVDDGSTDRTGRILRRLARQDSRIRVITRPNTGIVGALNDSIAQAKGEFLARMDADDVALPQRFERQVDFLRAHPDHGVVGSHVELMDPCGVEFRAARQPRLNLDHEGIERELLRGNGWAIIHPTVMMRRTDIEAVGGYRAAFQHAEDIDLFLRLAERTRLANLPDVLHRYRQHLESVNHTRHDEQIHIITAIITETYRRRGIALPPDWKPQYPNFPRPWKQYYDWAWRALELRRVSVARRHALCAVGAEPFNRESWRLMLCALRGR